MNSPWDSSGHSVSVIGISVSPSWLSHQQVMVSVSKACGIHPLHVHGHHPSYSQPASPVTRKTAFAFIPLSTQQPAQSLKVQITVCPSKKAPKDLLHVRQNSPVQCPVKSFSCLPPLQCTHCPFCTLHVDHISVSLGLTVT